LRKLGVEGRGWGGKGKARRKKSGPGGLCFGDDQVNPGLPFAKKTPWPDRKAGEDNGGEEMSTGQQGGNESRSLAPQRKRKVKRGGKEIQAR